MGATALLLALGVLATPPAATADSELQVWAVAHVVDASAAFEETGVAAADDYTGWVDEGERSTVHALPFIQDTTSLSEGVHTFHLSVNGLTASYDFVVDHTAPALTVTPTDGATADSAFYPEVRQPSWHVRADDSTSAVTLRCSTARAGGSGSGTCTNDAEFVPGLSLGDWVLTVTATDEAGHAVTVTRDFTYRRHPDAPSISGPTAVRADASFTFSSTAAGTTFECLTDNASAWVACTSPATYAVSAKAPAEGGHWFRVRVVYADGSPGPSNTVDFTVDRTAPYWLVSARPADLVGPRDAPLHWGFITVAGVMPLRCSLTLASAPAAWTPCPTPFSFDATPTASGTYRFQLEGSDAAGNVGTFQDTFVYDATPPVVVISAPARQVVRERLFTLSTDEVLSDQQCRVDLDAWLPCSGQVVASGLQDGRHSVAVRATDRVGNVATVTRAFDVDDTAPRVSFVGHPSATMHLHGKRRSVKTVELRTTEPGVLSCQLDGGAWYRCAGSTARPVSAATIAVRVRRGTHVIRVRAVDLAGNQGPAVRAAWFVKP